MIPLTVNDRARTFPLDQLLAAKRRGDRICLICGDDTIPRWAEGCTACLYGTGPMLLDADDMIVLNYGPKP